MWGEHRGKPNTHTLTENGKKTGHTAFTVMFSLKSSVWLWVSSSFESLMADKFCSVCDGLCRSSLCKVDTLRTKRWHLCASVCQTLVYWVAEVLVVQWCSGISLLCSIFCKSEPAECQEDFKNTSWWCFLASRWTKTALQTTTPNKGSNNVRCLAGSAVRLGTDYVHSMNCCRVQFRLQTSSRLLFLGLKFDYYVHEEPHQGGRQSLIQSGMTAQKSGILQMGRRANYVAQK